MAEKTLGEILCEKIRRGEVSCIGPDGLITPEAKQDLECKFLASEPAFADSVQSLREARRFSAAELNFTVY